MQYQELPAILAFSGHCETVDSPKYGKTLVKAINYLVAKGESNQGLLASKPGAHAPYEHGIATYAMAEAYSLNKNARAKVKRMSGTLRNASMSSEKQMRRVGISDRIEKA